MAHPSQLAHTFVERQLEGVSAWSHLTAESLLAGPDRWHIEPARRQPQQSVNQHCQLFAATDGWIAVQLARRADREALPAVCALVGSDPDDLGETDPWSALGAAAERCTGAELVAALRTMGIAASVVGEERDRAPGIEISGLRTSSVSGPVVDLSSMWAGPLTAKLIGLATGREVVDLESSQRPDPMRLGSGVLGEWLHTDRRLELFDHQTTAGLAGMQAVLSVASVIVTSGRRRALHSLGLDPAQHVAARGCIWVHVSGYGLESPLADAAAFGDDAAAAGGLVNWIEETPHFVADAVADPLTGAAAARTVVDLIRQGNVALVDTAMAGVAAAAASLLES